MITNSRPRLVEVEPGASALFAFNEAQACDAPTPRRRCCGCDYLVSQAFKGSDSSARSSPTAEAVLDTAGPFRRSKVASPMPSAARPSPADAAVQKQRRERSAPSHPSGVCESSSGSVAACWRAYVPSRRHPPLTPRGIPERASRSGVSSARPRAGRDARLARRRRRRAERGVDQAVRWRTGRRRGFGW